MQNFVFDLYGTLVDIKTDEYAEKFRKKVTAYFLRLNPAVTDFFSLYEKLCAERSGVEYTEIDLYEVFRDILNYGGNVAAEKTVQKAALYFRKKSRMRLKAYAGARTLLKKLQKRGARLFILTNAQACFTVDELKRLKFLKYFEGVEISSDFGMKKPAPEFFNYLAQKYSLDVENTVYTGNDFKADIFGAKSAGFKTAYIKSNLSPESDCLEKIKPVADFATDNFKALYGYLLSIAEN
ncbi:MAG: HAD family hydrolase [Clostridia bacterium]|nr:HAD family hydrolase [Clostridia bacterium]